ncbi:amidase [Vibrio owensii]|uniref:amidase n=1 Tax=Vibrio owensii TaxID=696485 RepID=UPI003AABB7ED
MTIDNSRRNVIKAVVATTIITASRNVTANPMVDSVTFTSPNDLAKNRSALRLSNAIKNREVSCVDVMKHYLNRIEAVNPKYNAIVALRDRKDLLKEAQKKDNDLAKGVYHGWMHGFPHAVKDLAPTKGIKTTMGSPIYKDWLPDFDNLLVQRIKQAGAIIIGKTNVPEFGLGSQSYNSVYGTTGNAYDVSKTAGGSSGGAACALALNLVPVADGSDMMGSLRNPAAYNNVIGFRPSAGRVPSVPSKELFIQQLGYAGPMGRNVADTIMLLNTMAGYDSRAPLSLDTNKDINNFATVTSMKGKRIAWLGDFDGYLNMEQGVLDVCEHGLKTFTALGAVVEKISSPIDPKELWKSWLTHRQWLIMGSLYDLYKDKAKRSLMKTEAIWEIENGLKLSALDVYQASLVRSKWYLKLNELFNKYDLIVLPSAQVFAFDKVIHWPKNINGVEMDTYHRWMEVVIPGSLSGLPIVNVPAGFSKNNQAMGLQLIGKNRSDFTLLRMAHIYEQAFYMTNNYIQPNI